MFGNEPNVKAHVEELKRKFRARFWTMIHLRRSGFKGQELVSLFNVFIRPAIEFCRVIYHSLLTRAQSGEIECMQRQVVKLAYGYDLSYAAACELHGITTLEERREKQVDKFAQKTLNEKCQVHRRVVP